MTADSGEVVVRDLGSTNGIRINGQRVEMGRLRPGDELSIAHIRYRLDSPVDPEATLLEPSASEPGRLGALARASKEPAPKVPDSPLAAAVRDLLPSSLADRCRIQVIVQMQPDTDSPQEPLDACQHDSSS